MAFLTRSSPPTMSPIHPDLDPSSPPGHGSSPSGTGSGSGSLFWAPAVVNAMFPVSNSNSNNEWHSIFKGASDNASEGEEWKRNDQVGNTSQGNSIIVPNKSSSLSPSSITTTGMLSSSSITTTNTLPLSTATSTSTSTSPSPSSSPSTSTTTMRITTSESTTVPTNSTISSNSDLSSSQSSSPSTSTPTTTIMKSGSGRSGPPSFTNGIVGETTSFLRSSPKSFSGESNSKTPVPSPTLAKTAATRAIPPQQHCHQIAPSPGLTPSFASSKVETKSKSNLTSPLSKVGRTANLPVSSTVTSNENKNQKTKSNHENGNNQRQQQHLVPKTRVPAVASNQPTANKVSSQPPSTTAPKPSLSASKSTPHHPYSNSRMSSSSGSEIPLTKVSSTKKPQPPSSKITISPAQQSKSTLNRSAKTSTTSIATPKKSTVVGTKSISASTLASSSSPSDRPLSSSLVPNPRSTVKIENKSGPTVATNSTTSILNTKVGSSKGAISMVSSNSPTRVPKLSGEKSVRNSLKTTNGSFISTTGGKKAAEPETKSSPTIIASKIGTDIRIRATEGRSLATNSTSGTPRLPQASTPRQPSSSHATPSSTIKTTTAQNAKSSVIRPSYIAPVVQNSKPTNALSKKGSINKASAPSGSANKSAHTKVEAGTDSTIGARTGVIPGRTANVGIKSPNSKRVSFTPPVITPTKISPSSVTLASTKSPSPSVSGSRVSDSFAATRHSVSPAVSTGGKLPAGVAPQPKSSIGRVSSTRGQATSSNLGAHNLTANGKPPLTNGGSTNPRATTSPSSNNTIRKVSGQPDEKKLAGSTGKPIGTRPGVPLTKAPVNSTTQVSTPKLGKNGSSGSNAKAGLAKVVVARKSSNKGLPVSSRLTKTGGSQRNHGFLQFPPPSLGPPILSLPDHVLVDIGYLLWPKISPLQSSEELRRARRSLLAFISTCRKLYELGLPVFSRITTFDGKTSATALCNFLTSSIPNYSKFLVNLGLYFDTQSSFAGYWLSNFVTRCSLFGEIVRHLPQLRLVSLCFLIPDDNISQGMSRDETSQLAAVSVLQALSQARFSAGLQVLQIELGPGFCKQFRTTSSTAFWFHLSNVISKNVDTLERLLVASAGMPTTFCAQELNELILTKICFPSGNEVCPIYAPITHMKITNFRGPLSVDTVRGLVRECRHTLVTFELGPGTLESCNILPTNPVINPVSPLKFPSLRELRLRTVAVTGVFEDPGGTATFHRSLKGFLLEDWVQTWKDLFATFRIAKQLRLVSIDPRPELGLISSIASSLVADPTIWPALEIFHFYGDFHNGNPVSQHDSVAAIFHGRRHLKVACSVVLPFYINSRQILTNRIEQPVNEPVSKCATLPDDVILCIIETILNEAVPLPRSTHPPLENNVADLWNGHFRRLDALSFAMTCKAYWFAARRLLYSKFVLSDHSSRALLTFMSKSLSVWRPHLRHVDVALSACGPLPFYALPLPTTGPIMQEITARCSILVKFIKELTGLRTLSISEGGGSHTTSIPELAEVILASLGILLDACAEASPGWRLNSFALTPPPVLVRSDLLPSTLINTMERHLRVIGASLTTICCNNSETLRHLQLCPIRLKVVSVPPRSDDNPVAAATPWRVMEQFPPNLVLKHATPTILRSGPFSLTHSIRNLELWSCPGLYLEALQVCLDSLETLRLRDCVDVHTYPHLSGNDHEQNLLTLPKLRALIVENCGFESTSSILDLIRAPSQTLACLTIDDCHVDSPPHDQHDPSPPSSFPFLRELTLVISNQGVFKEIRDFLSAASFLRSFSVNGDNPTIYALFKNISAGKLWPGLAEIMLEFPFFSLPHEFLLTPAVVARLGLGRKWRLEKRPQSAFSTRRGNQSLPVFKLKGGNQAPSHFLSPQSPTWTRPRAHSVAHCLQWTSIPSIPIRQRSLSM